MVENQNKRKPTSVHEEPRDTKDKSDDDHASHDMLCVSTMQVTIYSWLESFTVGNTIAFCLSSHFLHLLTSSANSLSPGFLS